LLHIQIEILQGRKLTTVAMICLRAQDADDIYWIERDEGKQESWKSGNFRKKETKGNASTSSITHNSNSNSNSLKTTHLPNNGKPMHSGRKPDIKDKSKGPDLFNKLGKDRKLKGDQHEHCIKEELCLY
jgi:hypothetical protein